MTRCISDHGAKKETMHHCAALLLFLDVIFNQPELLQNHPLQLTILNSQTDCLQFLARKLLCALMQSVIFNASDLMQHVPLSCSSCNCVICQWKVCDFLQLIMNSVGYLRVASFTCLYHPLFSRDSSARRDRISKQSNRRGGE